MTIDHEKLRVEAKRLTSLDDAGRAEEAVYQALVIGAQSEEAAEGMAELDRQLLADLFPNGRQSGEFGTRESSSSTA